MPAEMDLEGVRAFAVNTAKRFGYTLNGDEEFLRRILEGLLINFKRYGYFQCPCRDSWGNREKDRDILCPCAYCAPDVAEFGQCFCGLFLSDEFARSGKTPVSIPERRPDELFP